MDKILCCTGDYALVDPDIHELVKDDHWHVIGGRVVKSTPGSRWVSLHKLVLGELPGMLIDHIDRNPLNNQRSNLRFATPAENSYNRSKIESVGGKKSTSKYKGVYKLSAKKKFRAAIQFEGKKIHLGYHNTQEQAALEYNNKAKELYGEFAYLNEIEGENGN